MIILQQDKDAIYNFTNMTCIFFYEVDESITPYVVVARVVGDTLYELGRYYTEDRAKKIINEIYKCLKAESYDFTYEMPEN